MLTSRTWIISSGLVGALSLVLRSVLNFTFTGAIISLPTLNPLFIINGIIFAVAASASLFGHGSDSSTTKNQNKQHHDGDDDTYHYDEHDHVRSSDNSASSSFDQHNNKVHDEEEKVPVRTESKGSYGVSSPEVRFQSTAPEKTFGLRRPPTAPVKTFPQDGTSTDEGETMEEMWKRVKSEKQPKTPKSWQSHVISRQDSKMSTSSSPSSLPSPSRARKHPPSWEPSTSRTRKSPATSGMKLMERIPSWVKLKKELSMGREELNSRVEAFIAKFKDEMKLQRSESLRRYKLFRRSTDEKS